MNVRCEHQSVSKLGLLSVPFVDPVGVQCVKCHLLNMSPVPLNIAITQQRSMFHIKTIPSTYGSCKQMKECG